MKNSLISIEDVLGEQLSKDDLSSLEMFGALDWSDRKISGYFGFDQGETTQFNLEFSSSNSLIRRTYNKGKLRDEALIEFQLLKDAKSGNLNSVQELHKIKTSKQFSFSKLDIIGGFTDDAVFERIQEYISTGSPGELTKEEQGYLDTLNIIYSLDGHYGKRNTIKFIKKYAQVSYEKASTLYYEACEMFYSGRQLSREALRAKSAERLDTLYSLALATAKTPKDIEIVANIEAQRAKILALDKPDPITLPPEQYMKVVRLLSTSSEIIGIETINRDELATHINSIPGITESTRKRIRQESGVEGVDIIEYIRNGTQEEDS